MNNYGLSESEEIFLSVDDCEQCRIHERTIHALLRMVQELQERVKRLERKYEQ